MGIHSLDPSGWMVGLLRVGRASKCSCTSVAIRDGNSILLWLERTEAFLVVVFDIRLYGHVQFPASYQTSAHRMILPRDNSASDYIHTRVHHI